MTCSARFTGISGLLWPLFALAQGTTAPVQPAVEQAQPEIATLIEVTGVETLTDYATVGRLLGAIDGVRRVDVTEASGSSVTFRVVVNDGSAAIDRALESSAQLARAAASGLSGRLIYEFRH